MADTNAYDALAAAVAEDHTSPLESQPERTYGQNWFSDVAEYVLTAFMRSGGPIGRFRNLDSLFRDEGVYRAIMGPAGLDPARPETFGKGALE